jgi:hypothetical protein
MAASSASPTLESPSFYIFPYGSGAPPAGIPAENLKVLLLIRHSQGA